MSDDLRGLLAATLLSFPRFCGLLEIVDIETGLRRPMELTPIQAAYCAARSPRDIILKPRKVFMTTLEVARDLWWFLTKPGARVMVVCQSEKGNAARRTVEGMLRVALDSLRSRIPGVCSSDPKRGGRFDIETNTELVWRERDATLRIMEAGASQRTAQKGGRAQTINRLHGTETAYWEHGADTFNSLLNAMPPRMGGEAVIESTPKGAHGYYYNQWQAATSAESDFRPYFIRWFDHPLYALPLDPGERISPSSPAERRLLDQGVSAEAVKWYRRRVATHGVDKTNEDFPTDPASCFLLSGREFFDSAKTTELLLNCKPPEHLVPIRESGAHAELRVWGKPVKGESYVIGADTSEGGGGDDSAATVREVSTGVEVAKVVGQIKPGEFGLLLVRLALTYNSALVVVERNGPGGATLDRMVSVALYKNVFRDRDDKPGWHTNVASRPAALAGLEHAHRTGTWRTLDRQTLEQMRVFVWRERGERVRAEAAPGEKDDIIMAEAICWDVMRRPVARVERDVDFLEVV